MPKDVLDNEDYLKVYLDRYFDLIKEHCMDDNVPKNVISIWTGGVSTNKGCNDSLFTCFPEEHLYIIIFWCIIDQLELAKRESVVKGSLNDIKKYLMKLYYLYKKGTKKLRSLKELVDELGSLVHLTYNFIEDNVVPAIRACGTRWIGIL